MWKLTRPLIALVTVCPCPGAWGSESAALPQEAEESAVSMLEGLTDRPQEEQAIRDRIEAFVSSYNAADAQALGGMYADDAEVINEQGEVVEGRQPIESLFETTFKEEPGARIEIAVDHLRFLGPDAAKEEGRSRMTLSDGSIIRRRYTVLYSKLDGVWTFESVREEADPIAPPGERLKQLEWLVGDWFDEGESSVVRSSCRWSDDGHFLLRSYDVQASGESVMAVSERIGWDPLTRQIKSWVFDSTGGHSEGIWARVETSGDGRDGWLIKSVGVLPDGQVATASYMVTPLNDDTVRWESVDRTLAGGLVPGVDEHILVRRPPAPGR